MMMKIDAVDKYTICDALSLLWLFSDDMRRRKQDGDCSDHGKCSESDQTKTINHHCCKFPITDYVQFFIMDFHTIGYKLELFQDALKIR